MTSGSIQSELLHPLRLFYIYMEIIRVSVNLGTRIAPSLLLITFLEDDLCQVLLLPYSCHSRVMCSYAAESGTSVDIEGLFSNDYCTLQYSLFYMKLNFHPPLETKWEQHSLPVHYKRRRDSSYMNAIWMGACTIFIATHNRCSPSVWEHTATICC